MTVPRFWREIPQRYNLKASVCTVCEGTHYPPRTICPTCRRASIGKMERKPLSGEATLLEWTIVHKPAPGYEHAVPYVLALVQAKEGPILTGQIVDCDIEELVHDMPLQPTFRRIGQDGEDGVIHYGTKWAPRIDHDA